MAYLYASCKSFAVPHHTGKRVTPEPNLNPRFSLYMYYMVHFLHPSANGSWLHHPLTPHLSFSPISSSLSLLLIILSYQIPNFTPASSIA